MALENNRISELESQCAEAKSQVLDAKKEVIQLRNEYNHSEAEMHCCEVEYASAERDFSQAHSAGTAAREEVKGLQAQLSTLNLELCTERWVFAMPPPTPLHRFFFKPIIVISKIGVLFFEAVHFINIMMILSFNFHCIQRKCGNAAH